MSFVVYTKKPCSYCVKAKNLLRSKGFEYTEQEVGKDIIREDFISLFPDARTFPQIVLDDTRIGGYDDLVIFLETYSPDNLLLG